ncbi:BRO-N domain-containing protein [Bacillota bacterium HCP3S3_F1_1]
MNTAIEVFKNDEFGSIRTMTVNGEPMFVGKDVAEALGYKNANDALSKHVDADDKGVAKRDTLQQAGRNCCAGESLYLGALGRVLLQRSRVLPEVRCL